MLKNVEMLNTCVKTMILFSKSCYFGILMTEITGFTVTCDELNASLINNSIQLMNTLINI